MDALIYVRARELSGVERQTLSAVGAQTQTRLMDVGLEGEAGGMRPKGKQITWENDRGTQKEPTGVRKVSGTVSQTQAPAPPFIEDC